MKRENLGSKSFVRELGFLRLLIFRTIETEIAVLKAIVALNFEEKKEVSV